MILDNDDIVAYLKQLFPRRTFFIYFLPVTEKWIINYDTDLSTRDARKLMVETTNRFPDQVFQFERIPF